MTEPKLYQCHKLVHAIPMTRGEYNATRAWDLPANENPDDDGYLVIYNRGTEAEHVSWSPKAVFDDGYTEVDNQNLNLQLDATGAYLKAWDDRLVEADRKRRAEEAL